MQNAKCTMYNAQCAYIGNIALRQKVAWQDRLGRRSPRGHHHGLFLESRQGEDFGRNFVQLGILMIGQFLMVAPLKTYLLVLFLSRHQLIGFYSQRISHLGWDDFYEAVLKLLLLFLMVLLLA